MAEWKGLWSYVHADDETEGGRILALAHDVSAQFEMLTGEQIDVFVDKDAIAWGEDWRARVDEGLSTVAFFIPVLTPRYFMSPECRRELQSFARKAKHLGVSELVLPLLYVDVPRLHEGESIDELIELVRSYQWVDWRELRFEATSSEGYRRGVAALAARLVAGNERAVEIGSVTAPGAPALEPEDEPGLLDRLGDAEAAMAEWTITINGIAKDVQLVGALMEDATADLKNADAKRAGFAGRLAAAHRLATKLQEPADRILSGSAEFTSQLHRVDEGIRLLIERTPAEVQGDPDALSQLCEFFEVVRTLSASAHEGLGSTQGMIESSGPIEAMSRDLRGPLRTLRQGLTTMLEAREITGEWAQLVDRSGIDCTEASSLSGS
jgi:hypothetical protein